MRISNVAALTALSALLLGTNACSLLGTYATSAQSMMAQPGAAASPTTPGAASPGTPASSPSQPSGSEESAKTATPSTVSVSLHNGCKETVKLFFGAKPKFGSGRYSSLSSNTRTNETFRPGDQLWIVDDSQNGVSNVTISETTREIEVASSCDELRAK